jgi:hypothetical protein
MGVRIDEVTGFEPASLQAVLIDRRKIKSKGLPPILILMVLTKVYSLGLTPNNFFFDMANFFMDDTLAD